MKPETVLAIALVVGALAGTLSRLWASPNFNLFGKQTVTETIGNGLAALLIPYAKNLPLIGANLDLAGLPPIAAGAFMYFIASGAGDFLGNIRRKIGGIISPSNPPVAPVEIGSEKDKKEGGGH